MADDAIKTVVGEITKIAVEHGYNGVAPKTITGAIDALADTLAGSDVDSGQTVAQAVRALAPYIGTGGGGSLGALQAFIEVREAPEAEAPVANDFAWDKDMPIILNGTQAVADHVRFMDAFTLAAFAEGLTITLYSEAQQMDVCKIGATGSEHFYQSVTPFTDFTVREDGENMATTFTMPTLADDEVLVLTDAGIG